MDTGDIILQTTIPLEYDYAKYGSDFEAFISDFCATLKEESSELLLRSVSQIAIGEVRGWKQDTTIGKRYRIPTKKEKDELRRRLKARHGALLQTKTRASSHGNYSENTNAA